MPTKIAKNTFQGGMDKDTDPKQIKGISYADGYNVSLSQDGRYLQVSSFDGTASLSSVLDNSSYTASSDVHIMGMYYAEYLIDSTETDCVLVFTYIANPTPTFAIYAVKVSDGTVYRKYTEAITLSNADRYVDAVIYKERGVSYAYFTNGETPMMKLPCEITVGGLGDGAGGGTDYTRGALLLIRPSFRGSITDIDVRTGNQGSLLCGGYQFSWRLLNSDTNKYTKWSLLENPTLISMGYKKNIVANTYDRSYGGTGFVSDADIQLRLKLEQNYEDESVYGDGLGLYTHYQLAVVENINGLEDRNLIFKALQPKPISEFNFSSITSVGVATYTYSTNAIAQFVDSIDELTIDDAAILAVRALEIKHNRLIFGGVTYHDLDYDKGDPIVGNTTEIINKGLQTELSNDGTQPAGVSVTGLTSVTTTATMLTATDPYVTGDNVHVRGADQEEYNGVKALTRTGAGSYTYTVDASVADTATGTITATILNDAKAVGYRDPNNASNFVGHFRDELYRYAISYYDEFGNYSRPKVLDMTTVSSNSTSEGVDFRFPPRENGKYGTLLNGDGNIQALGLKLKGVDNHPTWAKGFVILRAPRKKKILFQTPVVPSILVQPAKVIEGGDYPVQRRTKKGGDMELLNVETANPKGSFFPKNFFHHITKSAIRYSDFYGIDNTVGRVYVTSTWTNKPMIVNSASLGRPFIVPANSNSNLLYGANSSTETVTIQYYINRPDIATNWDTGDSPTLTVQLTRRATGTLDTFDGYGIAAITDYETAVDTISLDLLTYDYMLLLTPTAASTPPAPTSPLVHDEMNATARISWKVDVNSHHTGFTITRSVNGAGYVVLTSLGNPKFRDYIDTSVTDDGVTTYAYKIAAYNDFGTGTYSSATSTITITPDTT